MRLGVDGRLVARGLGIAHFVTELMAHLDSSVEVVWFGAPEAAPERAVAIQPLRRLPYPALDGALGRRLARRNGVELMHFTGNTGWTRAGPTPFVLTVHDLIFLGTPLLGRSFRQALGHRYMCHNVAAAVRSAARVACPSQTTAAAVEQRFRPASPPRAIRHGMTRPPRAGRHLPADRAYAVAFSAPDPRKGVELALRGWLAAERKPERLKILAGAGVPDGFDDIVQPHVAAGAVELVRYLPREELWALLEGASVLIHPSSAEGFGLPVLEAMAAGVPVISGLTPTTDEIAQGAFVPIDPADPVRSIADGLTRLAAHRGLAEDLIARGRTRAEGFRWERTAGEYLALYEEALG